MIDKSVFFQKYQSFDKRFNAHKDKSYENLVNFSNVADKPIHRWFNYQEGYSPELVIKVLDRLKVSDTAKFVFDPFAGSGTTLLVAKQFGMKSLGFEINPFSAFIANVKTRNYTKSEINDIRAFKVPTEQQPHDHKNYELKIVENLFDKDKLDKIELLKKEIQNIADEKVKNALSFCLFSILEDISNYRKGGNGLKKKRIKTDIDPFIAFQNKKAAICNDLEKISDGPEPTIINNSCLEIERYEPIPEIDISIFSPPYANCFDPFEVYKMELWIGEFVKSYKELREKRKRALRSNLNADLRKPLNKEHRTELLNEILNYLSECKLWDKRLPQMLDGYFYDMYALLNKIYQKTKKGGYCVIVVGNSAYGNLAIPTDVLLAQLGEKAGFRVKEIIVARKNETSSQQHKNLGVLLEYLRESIVVMKNE
ncbi:MAG: hypothetical protein JRN10_00790 [Nitrososphaerota archaeon]|nr:hypothetical protein [Nitrososphaerota archaeon]